MLRLERHRKILKLLVNQDAVNVVDLAKLFSITTETVRRDLRMLEKAGHLKQVYGGAVRMDIVRSNSKHENTVKALPDLSQFEIALLDAYKNNPDMQLAINRLLQIDDEPKN